MTKNNVLIIALTMTLFSCLNIEKAELKSSNAFTAETSKKTENNIQVKVYTTAEKTNMRLTQSLITNFSMASQPLETEVAIFINPNKLFQEYLGVGGAITDASAEVFSN